MLTLIPTPIDEINTLEQTALELLKKASIDENNIFCVEEAKIARRRWISWGLDRTLIDQFVLFNEHTQSDLVNDLIGKMRQGKSVYLMSDCGLPAFCDPGQALVKACHESGLKVTSTPFYNSTILAVALSGFNHDKFFFEGFLPQDKDKRSQELKRVSKNSYTTILMDTPYRLNKLIEELKELIPNRKVFIGLDLNKKEEELIYSELKHLNLEKQKREFILVIGNKNE